MHKPIESNTEATLAAQDCVVERMDSVMGEVMFFDSEASAVAYKAHVGLSDFGTDPLTGKCWGRK